MTTPDSQDWLTELLQELWYSAYLANDVDSESINSTVADFHKIIIAKLPLEARINELKDLQAKRNQDIVYAGDWTGDEIARRIAELEAQGGDTNHE